MQLLIYIVTNKLFKIPVKNMLLIPIYSFIVKDSIFSIEPLEQ